MRGEMTAGLVFSVTLNVGEDETGLVVGLAVGFDVMGATDGLRVGVAEGDLVGLKVGRGVEIGGRPSEGRASGCTPAGPAILTVPYCTSQAHGQAFIISATSVTCRPMAKSMWQLISRKYSQGCPRGLR